MLTNLDRRIRSREWHRQATLTTVRITRLKRRPCGWHRSIRRRLVATTTRCWCRFGQRIRSTDRLFTVPPDGQATPALRWNQGEAESREQDTNGEHATVITRGFSKIKCYCQPESHYFYRQHRHILLTLLVNTWNQSRSFTLYPKCIRPVFWPILSSGNRTPKSVVQLSGSISPVARFHDHPAL